MRTHVVYNAAPAMLKIEGAVDREGKDIGTSKTVDIQSPDIQHVHPKISKTSSVPSRRA